MGGPGGEMKQSKCPAFEQDILHESSFPLCCETCKIGSIYIMEACFVFFLRNF